MMKSVAALVVVGAILTAALILSQQRTEPFKVSGFIEADEVRVGSLVGGRVAEAPAREGSQVKKGDLLIRLEPFDLLERRAKAMADLAAQRSQLKKFESGFREEEIAQAKARRDQLAARLDKLVSGPRKQEIAAARARMELAEAERELATSEHSRVKDLAESDVASREALDRAHENLKVAQATVQTRAEELAQLEEGTRAEEIREAQAQLEEADHAWLLAQHGFRTEDIDQARAATESAEATLRQIERQIDELEIRAPIDATVEAVDLQPGDLVSPNAPAVSLMDTSRLWVRAYLPEYRLDLQVGGKVEVSVNSYPGRRFAAHISFIAREAEFTPSNVQTPEERSKQVFRIKVTLDEGLNELRPGMSADVWLDAEADAP